MKRGRKSQGCPPPPPASASLALPTDDCSPFQYPSCQPGGLSLLLLLCPVALPAAGPSLASWKSPLACSLRPRAYTGRAAGSRPTGPAAVRFPDGAIPSRGWAARLQGAWRSRWVASVSCCLDHSPRTGHWGVSDPARLAVWSFSCLMSGGRPAASRIARGCGARCLACLIRSPVPSIGASCAQC